MNYLVDTNVFSELVKSKPDTRAHASFRATEGHLYVSAITIGQLRRGVERLPNGKRKAQLRAWLLALGERMQGRILGFNASTAHVWGQLKAKWEAAGVSVPSLDSQIAATAHRHQLTLVTRNTTDFTRTGVKLFDPFG